MSKSVLNELDKMLEDSDSVFKPNSNKKRSIKQADKDELEQMLLTITADEKEFALLNEIPYRTKEGILELKAAYKKAYKFTFWQRVNAAFTLIFKNKVSDKLEIHVLHNIPRPVDTQEDSILGVGAVINSQPISKRSLKYATQSNEPTLAQKLKEAGVDVPSESGTIVFEDLSGEVSNDLGENLQESLDRMTEPTIIETIKTTSKSTSKRETKGGLKNAPLHKRKPKVTPSVEKKKKK